MKFEPCTDATAADWIFLQEITFEGSLICLGLILTKTRKHTLLGGPWVELHKEIKVGSALFKYPSETEAVSQYAFIAEAKAPSWN